MPSSEALLVKVLQKLDIEVSLPKDPYPLDQAMQQSRVILQSMPFEKLRIPVAVWMLKRLTLRDPTVTAVIDTLKGVMNERHASAVITELSKGPSQGRKGILVKGSDEDRLTLNFSILNKVTPK